MSDQWSQDDIDHDMGLDNECSNCGGEGFYYSCFEEWACVDPDGGCSECRRRCDWCRPPTPKQQKETNELRQILGDALKAARTSS